MANAFGFKTKTDYSDVTAARQRQTAQTALQLKDAMKNVSSTIIEKRIAKKYDDPYSIEAMKERQVSYAGIDPTRSEQARKYINDAMTQQRLDIEQGYKQRAEERAERSLVGTEEYRKEGRDLEKRRLKLAEESAVIDDFTNAIKAFDGDINLARKTYPKLYKKFQELTQNNQTMLEEGTKTQVGNTISSEEIKNTENIIKTLEKTLQDLSQTRQNKRKRSQLTKELMQQKSNLIKLQENPEKETTVTESNSLKRLKGSL
jgi:hypothetical protein